MNSTTNDGGPAFPVTASTGDPRDGVYCRDGMSLRDWFAGQALAGYARSLLTQYASDVLCKLNERHGVSTSDTIATMAYELSDAMLAERNKTSK